MPREKNSAMGNDKDLEYRAATEREYKQSDFTKTTSDNYLHPDRKPRKVTKLPPLSTLPEKPEDTFRKFSTSVNVLPKLPESAQENDFDAEATEDGNYLEVFNAGLPVDHSDISPASSSSPVDFLPDLPNHRTQRLSLDASSTQVLSQVAKRRRTLPVLESMTKTFKTSERKRKQRGRAPSLMSVLGVVAFRKLYMAKLRRAELKEMIRQKNAAAEAEDLENRKSPDTPDAAPINQRDISSSFLPAAPRFGATLSTEAQFATLKGYEDAVIEGLERSYPSRYGSHWQRMRTQTPMASIADRRPAHLTASGAGAQSVTSLPVLGVHSRESVISSTSVSGQSTCSGPAGNDAESWRKQRQITYRLEYAMDMVDKIREGLGQQTISPRRKRLSRNIDPARSCEDWIRGWKQEFSSPTGHS